MKLIEVVKDLNEIMRQLDSGNLEEAEEKLEFVIVELSKTKEYQKELMNGYE